VHLRNPAIRIIPCLDVDKDRVVKGVRFRELRIVGDPVKLAVRYEEEGADEICLLDVTATVEGRETFLETVKNVSENISIPLLVGGGIRKYGDALRVFRSGADKVSINTAAVQRPQLVAELARDFGTQSIVVAIDVARHGGRWIVYTHGGRVNTGLDAVEWARRVAELGAGELLVTSIDRDGTRQGYDTELIAALSNIGIPIIASGGAGSPRHMYEAVMAGADAVLAAGIFHSGEYSISQVKRFLADMGIHVRL